MLERAVVTVETERIKRSNPWCLWWWWWWLIYNTLVLPTFLYGSENWTSTASQRRRIEAAEMKLLRPVADHTLYGHNTNDYISRELQITGTIDKIDEYGQNWFQHLQRMPQKPNPFEIIPLQTTRKESNWKTEETLERAVVTVETERIKGSNPWCLWWWWWWLINLRRFHFATSSAWGRCCFHFAVFLL